MRDFKLKVLNYIKFLFQNYLGLYVSFCKNTNPIDVIFLIVSGRSIKCVLDGGAYHGDFSEKMHQHFGDCTFHLFDPAPNAFLQLSNKFSNNNKFKLVNAAIGEKTYTSDFNLNKSPLTNSLKSEHSNAARYHPELAKTHEVTTVKVVSLDDYFLNSGFDYPDIIKLDLQGNEAEAIEGASNCLQHANIVLCEVQFLELYQGSELFSEINKKFTDLGFEIYQFFDVSRDRDTGRILFCDALYVKKGYLL